MGQAYAYLAGTTSLFTLVLAIATGTFAGLLAGLMPGINGRVGLMLATPLAIGFGPVGGAVFLVSFHAVVHTAGSVPAILLGVPTSVAEAATVIDGHAMMRKGEGSRAIGLTIGASLGGGVIGALCLLSLAPVALSVTRYLGAPEMAAMSILGLLSIAALSGGKTAAGLLSAALGIIVASVGLDSFSGFERLTFGATELLDGISPAAVVTGLFVVPEMAVRTASGMKVGLENGRLRPVLAGFFEAFGNWWLLVRSSFLGVIVGIAPGLGASVAVWLAYGHARQTECSPVPFGDGAPAGIIAPEAANNSKEGGALAPTLFFGVPSSSGMGILLAAFLVLGVEVGPRMLTNDPGFIYLIGVTIVVANVIAAPICIALAPTMTRLASIKGEAIAPVALAGAVSAAALTSPGLDTLALIAVFSVIGVLLKFADLPRSPMLLGFVLGPNLESGIVRSMMIQGWSVFSRPGVLILLAIAGAILTYALVSRANRRLVPTSEPIPRIQAVALGMSSLIFVGVSALLGSAPLTARVLPSLAALTGLGAVCLCGWRLWAARHRLERNPFIIRGLLTALFALMLIGAAVVDLPLAAAIFAGAALILTARASIGAALITSAALWACLGVLEFVK